MCVSMYSAPTVPRINWSQLNANRAEIEAAKWEGMCIAYWMQLVYAVRVIV